MQRQEGHLVVQCAFIDISRQKQQLSEAVKSASRDSLTGLKNKRALEQEMDLVIEESGNAGAFLILDLDNFKNVNDTCGHPQGDRVLQLFAACMKNTFRGDDFTGRMGGDEFVVFMRNVNERQKISRKAEQLMENFQSSLPKEFKGCSLSVSIGSLWRLMTEQHFLCFTKSQIRHFMRRKSAEKTKFVFMKDKRYGNCPHRGCSHTLLYFVQKFIYIIESRPHGRCKLSVGTQKNKILLLFIWGGVL